MESLRMRAGEPFGSLSMLEQSFKKSPPDLPISGCSEALFEPTLPDEQIKQTAIRVRTQSKRMEPSICRAGRLFRRLSSGTRSGFPSPFHAAFALGDSPCHKENQVPV